MGNEEMFIKREDGKEIFLRIWDDVENPKAIVQIFHGMAEHSGRYDDFAKYLNKRDIIVYADDHRGHGKTAERSGELGYLGEDGFYKIVEDEHFISNFIKKKYSDTPLYIFAHSFGSFIGQEYITKYSKEISGIIISGSAKHDGIDIKIGVLVSKIQSILFNDKCEAKMIDKLAFGSFNKSIENPKTAYSWLTRDEEEQSKYASDSYCAYTPTINFYKNLFLALLKLYKQEKLNNIDNNLPILVLAGSEDPVGKKGESVKRLWEQYKNLGVKNCTLKLYEEGRHELLNEINKEEVKDFIYSWIKQFQENEFLTMSK